MKNEILRVNQFFSTKDYEALEHIFSKVWGNFRWLDNFSLFLPGYKVHLQLLPLGSCGSFVLFSSAKSEIFRFLVWHLLCKVPTVKSLFFSSFVQFNSYCLQGPCSIDACRVLEFLWVFSERSRLLFLFFFVWNLQTVFKLKPMFSENPSLFIFLRKIFLKKKYSIQ